MSNSPLSTVTSSVVDRYTNVGKTIVSTYRTGAHRLFDAANTRYAEFVNKRSIPLMNDDVKASLIDVERQFAGALADRVASGTQRAEQAIGRIGGGVNGGIRRASNASERIESALDTRYLSTLASLAMPVAHVSLEIARRAESGAESLSRRVLGTADEAVQPTKGERLVRKPAPRRAVMARR